MNAPAIPKTLPSAEDIALARESGRVLSTVLKTRAETQQIDFHDDQARCVPCRSRRRRCACCSMC